MIASGVSAPAHDQGSELAFSNGEFGSDFERNQIDLFSPILWPKKPYCTNDYEDGIQIRSFAHAITKRYIQPNPSHLLAQMVFDLDYNGAGLAWEKANLAMPSWMALNRDNGHAHISYALRVPVLFKSENARQKVIRYAKAVQYAYADKLLADRGYSGLICKNPNHADWKIFKGSKKLYDLGDLAEHVELPKKIPKSVDTDTWGLGRNCSLFDYLRHQAYRDVKSFKQGGFSFENWRKHIESSAVSKNVEFTPPMSANEVKHIVKSVAEWTWNRFDFEESDRNFSQLQAHRGKQSGKARFKESMEKRLEAIKMKKGGLSNAEIARQLEVHRNTVSAWVSETAQ